MSAGAATPAETPEAKLARLLDGRRKVAAERETKTVLRQIERLELVEKYEQELGPEGSEFAIYDSGHVDDPLVVVKRPALVQWTKYEQSKQTPTDRYDFVAPSVVHPTKEAFNAVREKRIGVEIGASNLLAKLMGLQAEVESGK